MKRKLRAGLALFALTAVIQSQAQFAPIPVTPESYTYDVVVEEGAPFFTPATTASMDGGTNNTGNTWYEVGYNIDVPESGFPVAGSTIVSETLPDHSFQLAADYKTNNALLIDRTLTNATLTLDTPAAYSALSFLASAANGAVVLNYTINFSDDTSETGTFTAPDWFGGTQVAVTTAGRVSPTTGGFANVGSTDPRVYSADVTIANSTKVIESIELGFESGGANGRAGIFAVSGSTGADFTPIAVSGFNKDMIVEADATRPAALGVTDATLDRGTGNTAYTYYERGYNTNAPNTGLPDPGTTVTNVSAADHIYRVAASYTAANAAVVDGITPTATLTLQTPAAYSALSLLASSGAGAVTLTYHINYADATTQSGTVVVPDWFNVTPYAVALGGRVNVDNGSFNAVNTENPRLYSVDIAVEKTSTPIQSVQLEYASGNGHATIFALSGTAGAVKPIFELQPWSTNAFANATAELIATVSGTTPITLQWEREVNGTYTAVNNGGSVSGANTATLSFSDLTLADAGNYRLRASNVAGASTSVVATLNVLSDKLDVTSPGDTVLLVNGTTPANEPVENAIDDTTSKYLNFGTDGNTDPGFTGPVGLELTPVMGSTVVTGLRLYTANDAVDRDPADYKLEGSNDGGATYTVISSGALALPAARNAAGLALDPLTLANQEVNFANTAGYTSYRLTFTNVKNNTAANSMQIGEIELLGEAGTGTPQGPTVQVVRSGANVTVSWDGPGTLQATPTLDDPQWTDLGTTNPASIPTTENYRFFRVVR